jgi:hypothetical protein
MKKLIVVIVVVFVSILIIENYSIADERKFECKGEYSQKESKRLGNLFFTWHKFRWWVDLWSDSDGNIFVETEKGYTDFFPDVEEINGFRQLRMKDRHSTTPLKLKGQYNFPSKKLWMVSPSGIFNGFCEERTR